MCVFLSMIPFLYFLRPSQDTSATIKITYPTLAFTMCVLPRKPVQVGESVLKF